MSSVSTGIIQDLTVILNNIKSKDEAIKELSLNQLTTFLNINREFVDEIIEEMSKFLDSEKQTIEESFFYKIIIKFCSKLEEKNLSIIKFINKTFPILMVRIYYYKENKINDDDNQLFDMIAFFTKKCENINPGQIEFNLNTVFEKIIDEKNPPDDLNKYAMIRVLGTFLKNAPLVCFSKIVASTEKFKKIIKDFTHKDENIRKVVQDFVKEFLLILFNKDIEVRKNNSEMIFKMCVKDYLDKNIINESTILGVISMMKVFTVTKNGKINEIFKENYKACLDFIFNNLPSDKLSLKILSIQVLPDLCQFLNPILGEDGNEYIQSILSTLMNIYQKQKMDEKVKYEILKALGRLSRIESLKDTFKTKVMNIIGLLRNDFSDKKPFNESVLNSFSDFMYFYGEELSSIFTFEVYYEIFFKTGLKECHIPFIKRVLEIYKNHPYQYLSINLCILNIISYRIIEKEFPFKIIYKKRLLSSEENNNKKKSMIKKSSNLDKFMSLLNITKTSSKDNIKSDDPNADDLRYYNTIGDIMVNYIKEKKDKDKGYDNTNEVKIALNLLGFIDCDILIRDVLNFYVKNCLNLTKGKDKNIKIKVIELANSSWIPEIENKKINYMEILHNKNYVLEYLINLLLLDPDDEIKLLILEVLDNQRFYELLGKNNFFINFITIIEYDNNLVKEKTIKIVSQLIKYNYSTINAFVREKILQIYACLVNSNNQYRKEENIILLTNLVKYMGNHIVDEIEMLFSTLLRILKEETNFNKDISESKKQNEIIVFGVLSLISELMINQYYNKSKIEAYIKDIISISINILEDNLSTSSLKEETVLYTILSILTHSNKEWNIYEENINLVNIIIRILKKSQNKKSRLYALKIFGNIGAINPSKLNNLLSSYKNKNENKINIENNKDKNKQKRKNNYDFQKAINEKQLDKNTYYSMQILMKLIISNSNYDVTIRIIYLLKDIIQQLSTDEDPIIYLILPTLLSSLNNFEENTKYLILELILLIIKKFKNPILFYIENILSIVESYISEEMKNSRIFKDNKENRKLDISLDIVDKLCELYSEEISFTYIRIIPLILNLLSDRECISVNTKIKVVSILNNMGNSLSKYLYLIIPEINNCLNSLTNKKLWQSMNSFQNMVNSRNQLRSSASFYISANSPMLSIGENTIERKTQEPRDTNIDNYIHEKNLGHDILNLINNLIKLPGIIKYFEKLIQTLCFYMEASESDSDKKTIMEIFIKMLDTYQKAFLVYCPLVLTFSKDLGIPSLDYFFRFRNGIEKRDIIALILEKNPKIKTFLPYMGNPDSSKERNSSANSVKESSEKKVIGSPHKSPVKVNFINKSVYIKNTKLSSKFGRVTVDSGEYQGLTRDVKGAIKSLINEFDNNNFNNEEDWQEWFKNSTKKLFEQSPSFIIYLCHKNNVYEPQIINELYNTAFYSLWKECDDSQKNTLGNNLQKIVTQKKTPKNIALIILNLIEFINKEENEEIELNDFNQFGNISYACQAYAKALYYVENDYTKNDSTDDLIKLINLYINLGLSESAMGIYHLAQMKSKNSFNNLLSQKNLHLKMHQWQKAKQQIEEMQKKEKETKCEEDKSLTIKKAICLDGLSDWESLIQLDDELLKLDNENNNKEDDDELKINISLMLSKAALNLGEWDKLKEYSSKIKLVEEGDIYEENFFKAIISIKEAKYEEAKKYIDIARESIDEIIKSLLNESYERAYKSLLDNENLCELEDIIKLKLNNLNPEEYSKTKEKLKSRWDKTLSLKDEDISIYERTLGIRKIIFNIDEDYLNALRLSQICRKSNQFTTCMLVLNRLQKNLQNSCPDATMRVRLEIGRCLHDDYHDSNNLNKAVEVLKNIIDDINNDSNNKIDDKLKSNIYCYYGMWRAEKIGNTFNENEVNNILKDLELSTKYNKDNYKAWHTYALLNYKFFESEKKLYTNYAINAIEGFSKSICIGGNNISKILQDLLLLINIWFQIGNEEYIDKLMNEKIDIISIQCWMLVIPQLLARINISNPLIRKTLILLLKKIGLKNPRRLTYPLTVLVNSKSKSRVEAVSLILEDIKKQHQQLFKECELIINELNRCALCLHEQWSETIEEGAKLFFQSKDPKGSAKILMEQHQKMKSKPETMNEIHFYQMYKGNLNAAYKLVQDYLENNNLTSFKEAWDIYHTCFRSMSVNFSNFEQLDLKGISPSLYQFRESEIEMPGLYQSGITDEDSIIKISSFSRYLSVLNSKQHPRKIVIYGSDGKEYPFLLKGHEDIRQDQRVMQLFGLINALLSKDSDTRKKNLSIKRYPVYPLSHNTGIIGWVSNCDTLHQLIRDYRNRNKVRVNIEHFLMVKFNPKFDSSLSYCKLEVFKHALNHTLGIDIYKVLWNKSKNAEDWLERRTNYSRSMAVMSIVGYILGLGDRHPSNIMLDRISGKVIHIDFGDCFEVAMKREKFPEKVPFRLTRMLIKALEIGGIEGGYRITCENVMRVVREHKDSLNVILAAFVHDPLISFRLLIPLIMKQAKKEKDEIKEEKEEKNEKMMDDIINNSKKDENELEKKRIGSDERQLYNELEEKDDIESDDLNQIAKIVLERIADKLNGTDFNKNEELKVNEQVRRLINQATSHVNLSQSYLGWCPFW